MTLTELRRKIDRIDTALLALLNQRALLVRRVGRVKRRSRRPVFDGRRETQVLRRLTQANEGPFPSSSIRQIFRQILRSSRRLEIH